jgi:hypothetical protein
VQTECIAWVTIFECPSLQTALISVDNYSHRTVYPECKSRIRLEVVRFPPRSPCSSWGKVVRVCLSKRPARRESGGFGPGECEIQQSKRRFSGPEIPWHFPLPNPILRVGPVSGNSPHVAAFASTDRGQSSEAARVSPAAGLSGCSCDGVRCLRYLLVGRFHAPYFFEQLRTPDGIQHKTRHSALLRQSVLDLLNCPICLYSRTLSVNSSSGLPSVVRSNSRKIINSLWTFFSCIASQHKSRHS